MIILFNGAGIPVFPGPDLAWQHAVTQSEAFIISENSCIPTSRRARAGWHAGMAFHGIRFGNLTATEMKKSRTRKRRLRKWVSIKK